MKTVYLCKPLRIFRTATKYPIAEVRRSIGSPRIRGVGTVRAKQSGIHFRPRMGISNRTGRHPRCRRFRCHIRYPQRHTARRRRNGRTRRRNRPRKTHIPIPRRPPQSHRMRRIPPEPHDLHRPPPARLGRLVLHHLRRNHQPPQSPSTLGQTVATPPSRSVRGRERAERCERGMPDPSFPRRRALQRTERPSRGAGASGMQHPLSLDGRGLG